MIDTDFASRIFEENRQAILDDWFAWLRMPSVGADPRRLGDCARAAAWLKEFLRPLGFDVDILTPGSGLPVPVLVAERPGTAGAPVVLFYGHYDVQPEDPLDGWLTPPFEPALIDGRVRARGAQDNKGQVFAFLQGVKALVEAGEALPPLKLVIEGQEESGSSALNDLAPILRQRLRADVLMVCDTSCGPDNRPAIVAGLRGVQHVTVTLAGPAYDLHSGIHGGVAPNPAQGMAELVASLHAPDGSIAVAGFCDQVHHPSEEECAIARAGAVSAEQYEREVGCPPAGGARALDAVTRGCFEPTIEVNGIHSGYGGPGSKTVIPASAVAKLSMRLVPDQIPAETFEAVKKHLEARCPRGMRLAFSEPCVGAPGFRLPLNSPIFRLAADVLGQMDARGALFHWDGASIPVVARLHHLTGAAPLLVGFGREEDKIHCPNESFGLDQFVRVMTWATLMLKAL
ncbi:MAG: M20/M25/M40 family metallo-hydrolase [Verrucomicrobiota bacterium]|jgi:acetylornithine deacetylase/succinyl-diaminopimelate desuccinylase-like protein|nr:M20/M25/M40 family metallo-hydrolase [Verrucomicrobiota bacterium]